MKKFITAALLCCTVIASAQQKSPEALKTAVAKAEAAAENPKKAVAPATWIKIGKAYMDAYNAPAGQLWLGASLNEIQLVAKAKCNFAAGETWNEDYGVELAVRRLTNQVLLLERKFWTNMEEKMLEIYARATHHVDAYEHRIEHNRRRLNELKH